MPDVRRIRDRELHEMERAGDGWACRARNPRCPFVTADFSAMLAHVAGNQADRREEPAIPGIVGVTGDREAA